jgi:hypothetical protein
MEEAEIIDLSFSDDEKDSRKKIEGLKAINSKNDFHEKDFLLFESKLNGIAVLKLDKNAIKRESDRRIESIKHFLNDSIFSASIDYQELQMLKNYLMHHFHFNKDFEFVVLVLKILKRLILKNCSNEWIDFYKDLCTSFQSDFYEKYDSTLKLE